MISPLTSDAQGRLPIIILHIRTGAGSQEEPHGFRLVLDDAVVEGSVALLGPPVKAARVLNQKIYDVQRAARLLRDRMMQTCLIELLETEICCQMSALLAAKTEGANQM